MSPIKLINMNPIELIDMKLKEPEELLRRQDAASTDDLTSKVSPIELTNMKLEELEELLNRRELKKFQELLANPGTVLSCFRCRSTRIDSSSPHGPFCKDCGDVAPCQHRRR